MLDKERHLRLTLGGMARFQSTTGKSLLKGFNLSDMGESELVAFIWSCLIWEDRKLTVEDVGFMLDFERMNEISEKLSKTLTSSLPKSKDDGNPNALNLQTGQSSGQ
jgi:hypothetical protein